MLFGLDMWISNYIYELGRLDGSQYAKTPLSMLCCALYLGYWKERNLAWTFVVADYDRVINDTGVLHMPETALERKRT